jgi:hypothetical protein
MYCSAWAPAYKNFSYLSGHSLMSKYSRGDKSMRKVLFATLATAIVMIVPMASIVRAEDTTVIKKDNDYGDRTKTVIKKDEPSEKKVIIKKDHDD